MDINFDEELAWQQLELRAHKYVIQNIVEHCDTVLYVHDTQPQTDATEAWLRDELRELRTQLNQLQQLGYFL